MSYSARFSRRAVTRPGFAGARASARASAVSIHSTTDFLSASLTAGNPGGGITRVRIFSTTFSQVPGLATTAAALAWAARFRSAFFTNSLWHW